MKPCVPLTTHTCMYEMKLHLSSESFLAGLLLQKNLKINLTYCAGLESGSLLIVCQPLGYHMLLKIAEHQVQVNGNTVLSLEKHLSFLGWSQPGSYTGEGERGDISLTLSPTNLNFPPVVSYPPLPKASSLT